MSEQTTFPIVFYESKWQMFCEFVIDLFGVLCLSTFFTEAQPIIWLIPILGFIAFVPELLHCLKFLLVSKPVLIIERERIIVPDCVFWYKSIWYQDVYFFELGGIRIQGVVGYWLKIDLKNGSYKKVPLYQRYCENKLYEVSEIIQIIQTAHHNYKMGL